MTRTLPSTDADPTWFEAGRWDAEHGFMPMPTWSLGISLEECSSYALGYRCGLNGRTSPGLELNPHRTAERPDGTG